MTPKKCNFQTCYSDATCRDGRCVRHTRSTKPIRDYSYRTSGPKTDKPSLGVEIECYAPDETVYRALRSQMTIPYRDGSLPHLGCEFKLCAPVETILKAVPRFVQRLANLGAKVNSSCGLHVNLDARGVISTRKHEFIRWLSTWEDWWYSAMPPSRRDPRDRFWTGNRGTDTPGFYCRSIVWGDSNGHYTWANTYHNNRVEIRIHPGTLNKHKITGWLHVMADLLDILRNFDEFPMFPPISNPPTTEQLKVVLKRSTGLQYMLDRIFHGGVVAASSTTSNGMIDETEYQ